MEKEYAISPILTSITQDQITYIDQENTNGEGWKYYSNGQVIQAVVFNNEISGIIREYLEDFKVQIKVNENEIACSCTCNSENIICIHIVALLYSWANDREEFINVGNFINRLHSMDKDILVNIIERFLVDDPRNVKFFEKQKDIKLDIDGLVME